MEIRVARPAAGARFFEPLAAYPGRAARVAVLATVVYLALLPLIERSWRVTGDEPHYLLAAHSLVQDGDLDLANNYDRFDYLAFYLSRDIERQVRLDQTGRQILNHQPGLPLLIAPAYALAGRAGVLLFQAILGGILAGLTFHLAALICQDDRSAAVATSFVALSPPLFFYPYLVYPELIGALLATGLLVAAVQGGRPGPAQVALVCLSLLALPWFNRRFIALAIALALLVAWSWWRDRLAGGKVLHYSSLLPPAALALSLALLWGFNSRLSTPARADIVPATDVALIWERLARGVGWLVDQQRGLFIFGPVFLLAAWGLPLLIQASFRQRNRHWFVLAPVLLSLAVTAAAGGYWIAWELGPRFLVVALPALAPLLALAWRVYGRRPLWRAFALALFAVSLANSLVIVQNPELPYKSSLPLFYGQKLELPLADLLPDLAGRAFIETGEAAGQAEQVIDQGRAALFARSGQPLTIVDSGPLPELPAGHYRLTWPARVEAGLPPTTELLRLSLKTLEGFQVFNRVVSAAELPADGSYGLLAYSFTNPNIDRWRMPLIFHAVSSGRGSLWTGDLAFSPSPFYAWFLPYLLLAILGALALAAWWRYGRTAYQLFDAEVKASPPGRRSAWAWGLLLVMLLAALGHLAYQSRLPGRVYDAGSFLHYVGRAETDPAAADGRAWLVDPAVDPPQKAIYGPFDFYDPGLYQVAFRLKLSGPAGTGQPLARLQVSATANFEELVTQPLLASHFSQPERYHEFVLTVNNPRRQALSFEVYYLGLAPLMIDQVSITAVSGDRPAQD